jgi:HEAT repeat protein
LDELAARRSKQALPALLDRLADADGDVRRAAADGLAELGNEAALAALERALPAETIEKTRLAMAQAIAELRPSGGTRGDE